MSKKVKILLLALFALVGVIGVVLYIVSSKIDPKMIKKAAIEAIESNLKDSKATIGKVSYSLGFNVKLNLENLEIKSTKTGPLASLGHARVDIPLLSILTNGGTVDVKIDSPQVVYKELKGGKNNWQLALGGNKSESGKAAGSVKKDEKAVETKEVELPSFLEKSRIDLSISNLKAILEQLGKPKSEIEINKILFKNLNLKKTTAFEVVSKLSYALEKDKTFSAKVQLVGEVSLNNLLKSGAIDTNMLLNIDDISAPWLPVKIPAIKNAIKVKMTDSGAIKTEVRSSSSGLFNIELDAGIDKKIEVLSLNKIQSEINLNGLKGILSADLKQGLNNIELEKSVFKANGNAVLNLSKSQFDPNISFELSKPMVLKVQGQNISTSMRGSFRGRNIKAKITNELMSGVATIEASTKLDPLNLPSELSQYSQINAKALITNVKLEKPFLQEILYGGKKKEDKEASESSTAEKEKALGKNSIPVEISLPPFKLSIEGKHIFIAKQEMNVNGLVEGGGNDINVSSLKFSYGGGLAGMNAKVKAKTSENISSNFSVNLKNMEMSGLNAFLPPMISEVSGKYQGKVAGKVLMRKTLSYDVKADVGAKNGELKNLNLSSFLMPLVESLSFLKGKVDADKMKVTDKFESLNLSARATEKKIDIGKFLFVGNHNSAKISAKGFVSMLETGNSEVKADIVVKDISNQVKTYTGAEEVPVLLKGKGFGLLPQAKYTTDKLAERAAKKELKKQEKQIKKTINKEGDKLKKKLEDKAKDLLKGFRL